MEQAQSNITLEQPLSVPDQAMFDRVWNRVMAQPDLVPGTEPEPAMPAIPQTTLPAPVTAQTPQRPSPVSASPGLEPPAQYDVSCLGASSLQYAPLLREMMDGAYAGWNTYRALVRQAQGISARQLRALAEDQQRLVRQLGAVYFLLTGERFAHSGPVPTPSAPLNSALREMFVQEQRWRRAYVQAMHQVEDPCLSLLFDELAGKTELHMDAIRRILEGM